MSKDASKDGPASEEVKDMELDERPRPIRKAENTTVPQPEEGKEKKRKGTRKVD